MSTCSLTVLTVRGRVGLVEAGRHVRVLDQLDHVGRVTAAGALDMEDVDGACLLLRELPVCVPGVACEGCPCALQEPRLVQ